MKKQYNPTQRVAATSYCPKCKVTCWYEAGKPHYQWCDAILIDIKEKENEQTNI